MEVMIQANGNAKEENLPETLLSYLYEFNIEKSELIIERISVNS